MPKFLGAWLLGEAHEDVSAGIFTINLNEAYMLIRIYSYLFFVPIT